MGSPRERAPRASARVPAIVGIGASAGGIEALEAFLKQTPTDTGMAFVVVQHLDPTHAGMMPELLQRATTMRVAEAGPGTIVQPNRVYVIPPNRDMAILRGALQLLEPTEPRGLRLPIDFFFRSLAEDCAERSIGVVLSGMGSDGTLGLRAIKEKAGLTLAQAPDSARFSAMPGSAIAAGVVDIVGPVEDLPARIVAYLHAVPRVAAAGPAAGAAAGSLGVIAVLVRERTGIDFSLYKRNSVVRRIERRMGIHQIATMRDYARLLQHDAGELDLLGKELLIGVTSFFRDRDVWEALAREAIPALTAARTDARPLRAWVPACSTGEEAYTLAIVLTEALARLRPRARGSIQIFATDVDGDAIAHARRGSYPANIGADVSPERLDRFFVREETGYRVSREIRAKVVFAVQNVVKDAPFTKMDIISCRNLLIYFGPELQKAVMPRFHYGLGPGGVLVLGNAETIGSFRRLFEPINAKARIFRRVDAAATFAEIDWPLIPPAPRPVPVVEAGSIEPPVSVRALAERLLLEQFSPAAVLATGDGDIVYISGRTGDYLEPAAGKANWNIHVMAREGLRTDLTAAFRRATQTGAQVDLTGVAITGRTGTQAVDVSIAPIAEPSALAGMVMVVFRPAAPPRRVRPSRAVGTNAVREISAELQRSREELETTREEMVTFQEELQSANEELQSANEELQSANEELQSANEELQSTNEELQVVNQELQARLEDLALAGSDMRNLLDSTDVATIFLDQALRIRRFTPPAKRVINVIETDLGRPFGDITTTLTYPDMAGDVETVLRTGTISDRQVPTPDGRWFQVRILPYRTVANTADGVVLTFFDITPTKALEAELRRAREGGSGHGDGAGRR